MPKFHLLYFKNLLDIATVKFFNIYNSYFIKINDKYVLSKNMPMTRLMSIFRKIILEELLKHVVKYNRISPNYYIIIGSCFPKDNLLLEFKDDKYFPSKVKKILNHEHNIKYVLKEKDIDIDIIKFNNMCIDLSNEFLKTNVFSKKLGKDYRNIFFVQHNKVDCYVLFKLIKFIYGKRNCINMYTEKLSNEKLPLIAINDIIGKYINKSDMNNSQKLKLITEEIRQYIDEKIKNL